MAEPRTEAGKRLAAYVSPASDVHEGWYPWRVVRDAILAIEAEAAHPESDPATPQGELRAALDLLNSLGIAGPNTVHRIETAEDRADPKRSQDDRDLDRALAEVGNDDEWCICGRVWPCDAKRLVDLLLAALRAVPAEAEEHDGECVMAGQVEPADASGGGEGLLAHLDALADALNAWDQGEPPRPDTHRHWNAIVAALGRSAR